MINLFALDLGTDAEMTLPQRLFTAHFAQLKTQHSRPYLNGALAALERIFHEDEAASGQQYPAGTAQFDAFVAGRIEGHAIAAEYLAVLTSQVISHQAN